MEKRIHKKPALTFFRALPALLAGVSIHRGFIFYFFPLSVPALSQPSRYNQYLRLQLKEHPGALILAGLSMLKLRILSANTYFGWLR